MKKIASTFLLVAACAALVDAAPAAATFPGRPGPIAFDDLGAIWTVSPEHHGSPTKLAEGADPAFSPDGRLIAFMRGDRLMVMRSDGSGERLLYRGEDTSDPCFAADGTHIFFRHDTSGEGYADLYSIPLTGGAPLRLTHTGSHSSEIDSEAPDAAPNGRFVAFQRNEWIWTMRPDGSRQRRLTRGANPSVSPDSDEVVASRGEDLVLIGAAGGHERVIHPITRKKQFGELIRSAGWPAFSPDGLSVAFTYKRIVNSGPANHGADRLAVFSLLTGKLRILTGPTLAGRDPSWQPLH